jgi:hypothetical protein
MGPAQSTAESGPYFIDMRYGLRQKINTCRNFFNQLPRNKHIMMSNTRVSVEYDINIYNYIELYYFIKLLSIWN